MNPQRDNPVRSMKELAGIAIELQEHEIKKVGQIVATVQYKYKYKPSTAKNLENLRDEILTKLAEVGILASFDPTPCLYGKEPILDIVGRVGDPGFQKPTDHEQKGYGVKKALERNEDFLGQTGEADVAKAKRRAKK